MRRDTLPDTARPGPAPGSRSATDVLRSHGCRATKPRVAVLEAVLAAGRPLDAAELAARAQQALDGIHEATVYRTIAVLSELGIVTHVHAGHGPALVELAGEESLLVVCTDCGRIERVPAEAGDRLADEVDRQLGFALDLGHFALEGRCSDCRDGG
jgi:Fur family ferric uptake transcriptional regulator